MAIAIECGVQGATPTMDGGFALSFRYEIIGDDVPGGVTSGYYEVPWAAGEGLEVIEARRAEALRAKAVELGVTVPPNRAYLIAFTGA